MEARLRILQNGADPRPDGFPALKVEIESASGLVVTDRARLVSPRAEMIVP